MDKDQGRFNWTKDAIIEMIDLWQTYECLYNSKHKFYHNRHARYEALNEIANKMKTFNPAITPNDVKIKLTYLRGQYTREISKTKERKSGAGSEDVYVSSTYWFDKLYFLKDFLKERKGTRNSLEQVDESCDSSQMADFKFSPAQPSNSARVSNDTLLSSHSMSQEESALTTATDPLKYFTNVKKVANEKDEAFCNYIKMELNDITNQNIKDQLMETIALTIFDAKKQQRQYDNVVESNFSHFKTN